MCCELQISKSDWGIKWSVSAYIYITSSLLLVKGKGRFKNSVLVWSWWIICCQFNPCLAWPALSPHGCVSTGEVWLHLLSFCYGGKHWFICIFSTNQNYFGQQTAFRRNYTCCLTKRSHTQPSASWFLNIFVHIYLNTYYTYYSRTPLDGTPEPSDMKFKQNF